MTYDESDAMITQELCGRTIDHVERVGKQIDIVTTCGHVITLQSDVYDEIQYVKTGVRVTLPGISVMPDLGLIR
jgi:hypothetical protein